MDRSLSALRELGISQARSGLSANEHLLWPLLSAATTIADAVASIIGGPPGAKSPKAIAARLLSLALTSDSAAIGDDHTREVFLSVAAMVTLLQRRAEGTAMIGESIILALG